MRVYSRPQTAWISLLGLACAIVAANGCSRTKHRLHADHDAYSAIAERNVDPRWCVPNCNIEMDPRSRYFDPYDPDHSPMPLDDPASHQYLHLVDGKKGWKHWHDNGDRPDLENPPWYMALADYVELAEDGSVKLDIETALKLAYMHSPAHQSQLETLYLSSLDVTEERFNLDTRFFGGYDTRYANTGTLAPPGLRTGAARRAGSDQITVGEAPALRLERNFATAGELAVDFANSFVVEFTGGNANLAASLASFTFTQPLLRNAGRDVFLHNLTLRERALLANLRAYSHYRQGLYTQVAIGDLGVEGPQRRGADTNITGFSGQGGVGGYIGLLEQLQRKRNAEANLVLQERSLARLEAFEEIGVINLVQVDRLRQSVQGSRAALLGIDNAYELALDNYKLGTLGLPPDLPIELDDSLIRQFQLVAPEATSIEDSVVELQVVSASCRTVWATCEPMSTWRRFVKF